MAKDDAWSLMFLSCDLVGSTDYKQSNPGKWQPVFLTFYREFPQMLGTLAKVKGFTTDTRSFRLWKAVGDELIFTVKVRHENDVFDAVDIWVQAMDQYEKEVLVDVGMSTKGGAFIATFPGPDSEATVPIDPAAETSDKTPTALNAEALKGKRATSKFLFDYFGPSVDTGFRVLSACSQRHFTMSVEVTLALLMAHWGDKENRRIDAACFLGLYSFKGVWGGRDYPVFALDRHCSDTINFAMQKLTNGELHVEHAIDVCRGCLASPSWFSGIYLEGSGHDFLKIDPVSDPLATGRDQANLMVGSESIPPGDPASGEELPSDPPLSRPVATDIPAG